MAKEKKASSDKGKLVPSLGRRCCCGDLTMDKKETMRRGVYCQQRQKASPVATIAYLVVAT
jgi:hypothetical protein